VATPGTETLETERLRARADAHGVTAEYWDASGEHRLPPASTLRAVLAAIGVDPDGTDEPRGDGPWPPCLVVIAGHDLDWRPPGPAVVVLEAGIERTVPAVLGDLPLGYHRVRAASGDDSTRLIVVPERCYLPPRLDDGGRAWAGRSSSTPCAPRAAGASATSAIWRGWLPTTRPTPASCC